MPRMRSIPEAARYLKSLDPDTCMTVFRLRQMVNGGEIKSVKAGKKFLINLDELESYLASPKPHTAEPEATPQEHTPGIRPVKI